MEGVYSSNEDNASEEGNSSDLENSSDLDDSSEGDNSADLDNSSDIEDSGSASGPAEGGMTDVAEMSIHFLELGNQYTGDCTLIDVGDTEVLIDAGSRKGSAATIKKYVDQYCDDGVLEYVIATHADQDHIAGFVGNSGETLRTGILYQYSVETLIQFPLTNKNTQILADYRTAVEYAKGKGTTVYTALECWENENGASRSYQLGEGVTMNVLYQQYYEVGTSDENDYSVCMLLSQGENHYLFTGDLESKGEKSLVSNNNLPKCKLFKGGHHGSPTSNTTELLSVIQPEIVCVCCCCGSSEYTTNVANMFPSQAFVNNVAPYTDKVYVTTMTAANSNGYQSMNGNIVVTSKGGEVSVNCSNNNTLFKDTEWFKKNRTMPAAWIN